MCAAFPPLPDPAPSIYCSNLSISSILFVTIYSKCSGCFTMDLVLSDKLSWSSWFIITLLATCFSSSLPVTSVKLAALRPGKLVEWIDRLICRLISFSVSSLSSKISLIESYSRYTFCIFDYYVDFWAILFLNKPLSSEFILSNMPFSSKMAWIAGG